MARQKLNQGAYPTGAGGDNWRTGSAKLDDGIGELYNQFGANNQGVLPSALPVNKGGTGATTAANARTNLDVFSKTEVAQAIEAAKPSVIPDASTTAKGVVQLNNTLISTSVTLALTAAMGKKLQDEKLGKAENAVSASKLETARTVSFSGAATGSFGYDGSANSSCVLTLANSGVVAGTYGNNATVPVVTVDAKGLLKVVATQAIRTATTAQTGIVQLANELNDASVTKALTANQGKLLSDRVNDGGVFTGAVVLPAGSDLFVDVPDVCQTYTLAGAYANAPAIFGSVITGMLSVKTRWFVVGISKILTIRHLSGQIWENIRNNTAWRGWQRIDGIDKLDKDATAVSATKLQTARTIGGVGFDGTTNINLPGVNATGNQSTSGNAATATKLQTARKINGVDFDGSTDVNISVPLPTASTTVKGGVKVGTGLSIAAESLSVQFATQAEANAGTDDAKAITSKKMNEAVKNQLNATGEAPMFVCRAWVNFSDGGSSPQIKGEGNVLSVTKRGVNEYTVTFKKPLSTEDYAVLVTAGLSSGSAEYFINTSEASVSSVLVYTAGSTGTAASADLVSLGVFC